MQKLAFTVIILLLVLSLSPVGNAAPPNTMGFVEDPKDVTVGDSFNTIIWVDVTSAINAAAADNMTFLPAGMVSYSSLNWGDLFAGAVVQISPEGGGTINNGAGWAKPVVWGYSSAVNSVNRTLATITWNAVSCGIVTTTITEGGTAFNGADPGTLMLPATIIVHPKWTAGFTALPFNANQIDLSWIKQTGDDYVAIRKSLSGYPTSITDGTLVYNGTGSSTSDTGLTLGDHWYYSAFAYNETANLYSLYYQTDDAITIIPIYCASADFSWTPLYPNVNDTVTFFNNACRKNVTTWRWDFGDGTIKTDDDTVTHIYTKTGYYDVTLKITDDWGETDSTTNRIYIGNQPHIPEPQPPKYPGYTVPEMYQLLRGDKLPATSNSVKIMVLDTGVTTRSYNGVDLNKIKIQYNRAYNNGIDENGHGSWVNYAVAYLLQTKAPNSVQYSYRMLDKSGGCTTQIFLDALDQAKKEGVDVVSISAGADFGRPDDPIAKKCDELKKAGIIVIVAAGNKGPATSSISSPGVSDSVIAVGASDPKWYMQDKLAGILNLADDVICYWSSRGPINGVRYYKPDVTAPGESIWGPWLYEDKRVSGTSMATPFVAAGVAVIVAENKDIIDQAKNSLWYDKSAISNAMEEALKESCYNKGDKNTWGAGIVQLDKANDLFAQKMQNIATGGYVFPFLLIILLILIAYGIYKYYKRPKKKWWMK